MTVGQQAADRAATQCRDPAQARVFLEHINLSLCEHTTIANQHDAGARPNRFVRASTWSGTVLGLPVLPG